MNTLYYDDNGNITRIHDTDQGGKDYNMEFDALNRLVRYLEDTGSEKAIFTYDTRSLLRGREVDGDITKFGYDAYSVLNKIIKSNGDQLDFNFDMLGRLRGYDTDSRESTFNYDGTKRFGDYDTDDEEWKRYHWCRNQFLGYEDDTNTYYIVPDVLGSTKVIMDSNSVINRLDYDFAGYLRNKTTDPQVELLYNTGFYCNNISYYILDYGKIYDPRIGYSIYYLISPPYISIPVSHFVKSDLSSVKDILDKVSGGIGCIWAVLNCSALRAQIAMIDYLASLDLELWLETYDETYFNRYIGGMARESTLFNLYFSYCIIVRWYFGPGNIA